MITNINSTNSNQIFGTKLGSNAKFYFRQTPEKLEQITQKLAGAGEATTVVDIMTANSRKGKMYSLRLFSEKFGEIYNLSLLKDNYNKDVVKYSAQEFLTSLENLTKRTVEQVEYSLFDKIKKNKYW